MTVASEDIVLDVVNRFEGEPDTIQTRLFIEQYVRGTYPGWHVRNIVFAPTFGLELVYDNAPNVHTETNDHVERRGGFDRKLHTDPPSPEYRQIGWHCIYHEQTGRNCHNPLDCDLVPIWALKIRTALERMNGL
jgi:hypothetical protein